LSWKLSNGGSHITDQEQLTELIVDGKRIPINQFVQDVFAGVIGGVLMSIHGIEDDWKLAEIKIKHSD
jgi:hypothetical protein